MQRLNNTTLDNFLNQPGVNAVMFGAPRGEATTDQAVQFADAWLECHDDADFGYIDAFANVSSARDYAVRVLPTTMIAANGEVIAWIEGRCSSTRIEQAIRAARRVHVHAHA